MLVSLSPLYKLFLIIFCIGFLSASCERLKEIEDPVSFISFEKFELQKSEIEEFGLQEKIVDAWVFQNGQPLGVYQMPLTLPVFGDGEQSFRIFPGVLERGVSLKRFRHPFYLAFDTVINAKANDTAFLFPNTTLDTLTTIPYSEQFEVGNSLSGIGVTSESAEVLDGGRSGKWIVDDTNSVSEVIFPLMSLPNDGRPIIFEINYKNSLPFDVFMREFREGIEYYIVTTSTQTEWNTLYVNLTPEATQAQAQEYQIILRAPAIEDKEPMPIFLDNIKIMHR